MTVIDKLDELKRLADATTPAYYASPQAEVVGMFHVRDALTGQLIADCTTVKDRDFIAASRTAMPQLVEALLFAREQFGLMAEGEGPDAEVYMEMSRYALKRIAELLEVGGDRKRENERLGVESNRGD